MKEKKPDCRKRSEKNAMQKTHGVMGILLTTTFTTHLPITHTIQPPKTFSVLEH